MEFSQHWNTAYTAPAEDALTWFEAEPAQSLQLVRDYLPKGGALVDVGGGASRLVDHLLADAPGALTVLDLSATALEITRERLGEAPVTADMRDRMPDRTYDLWHDRAAFHFLTERADQASYLATLDRALRPGGVAIIATFDLTGPEKCSNLPVQRYSPQTLAAQIDHLMPDLFDVIHAEHHAHHTPLGNTQMFQISIFRKKGPNP